jgi:methyl-accepting chemotaxis protein
VRARPAAASRWCASEVRALAQRSAGAAKEIKALISTSTSQVNDGVQLVGQTGQALDRIVTKVAEINGLVAEIAASAKEQALGLHEVNASINQMDHVTQQNAAMVEETTAACVALASEAQQLSAMIGRFDIGPRSCEPAALAAAPQRPRTGPARTRSVRVGGGGAAAPASTPTAGKSSEPPMSSTARISLADGLDTAAPPRWPASCARPRPPLRSTPRASSASARWACRCCCRPG